MVPENPKFLLSEDQSLQLKMVAIAEISSWSVNFPGKPSKEYVARIAFQEGKSLGASVAEVIMAEKELLLDRVVDRLPEETEVTPESLSEYLNKSILIDFGYSWLAKDFLIAEEVIRSGEPPTEPTPVSLNDPLMEQAIADAVDESLKSVSEEDGRPLSQAEYENKQTASQADSYLWEKRLGNLLLKSTDPLEFIDSHTKQYLRALHSPYKDFKEQFIRGVMIELLIRGRERFYVLYIAATLVRAKAQGLTASELHQEFLRLTARKNQRLDPAEKE